MLPLPHKRNSRKRCKIKTTGCNRLNLNVLPEQTEKASPNKSMNLNYKKNSNNFALKAAVPPRGRTCVGTTYYSQPYGFITDRKLVDDFQTIQREPQHPTLLRQHSSTSYTCGEPLFTALSGERKKILLPGP